MSDVENYYGIKVTWVNFEKRNCNYCVYKLTFPSGRIYIGSVSRKNDTVLGRIRDHCKNAINGTTLSSKAIKSEKTFKVEVIRVCHSKEEATEHEKYQINGYARAIYNTATKSNTYYDSYRKYNHIINDVLLNEKNI